MGGISITFKIQATSPEEAYKKIIAQEKEQYGSAHYTGSAATCSMGYRRGPSFQKYSESNQDKAYEYINSIYGGEKYRLDYVILGQVGYRVVTVEKEVVKHGTPRSIYNVYLSKGNDNLTFIKKFYDKLEAVEYAERYVGEHPFESYDRNPKIVIRRSVEYSNRENDDLYRFVSKVEVRKTKIKGTKNQTVKPLYEYIFYGVASY